MRWRQGLRETAGIARSLRIYYGSRSRRRRMEALYRRFVAEGDLVFDIGAHVGDRVAAFRRLGARVVAVEPQPAALRWLRLRYGRDARVTLVEAAASARAGALTLHINRANPTISTASAEFIVAAEGAEGWAGEVWDGRARVRAVTLDDLIARHGVPAFVKIDVEGFERRVLQGLSRALPTLSFEFTTIQRGVALACLDRLASLGTYRFNAALGESHSMVFAAPVGREEMADYLAGLPHAANSGDVYAERAGSA